jgi:predicted RNA-binding protein YlqC (UPF0109 family)
MRDLVEFMAKGLVDNPDAVSVRQFRGSNGTVFRLIVDPDDKGWVIGRRGRVANAMRTVLRVAGATRGVRRVILEIA